MNNDTVCQQDLFINQSSFQFVDVEIVFNIFLESSFKGYQLTLTVG